MEKRKLKVANNPNYDIKNVFSESRPLIHTRETSGVVYKLKCKECDGAYTGQTKQCLQVLASRHDYHKRTVLEMLFIKKDKESINNRCDTQNFSHIYNNLISSTT